MYTLYICILSLSEFKFYSEVYHWRGHKAFNYYMYNHNKKLVEIPKSQNILIENMKYVKELLFNKYFIFNGWHFY